MRWYGLCIASVKYAGILSLPEVPYRHFPSDPQPGEIDRNFICPRADIKQRYIVCLMPGDRPIAGIGRPDHRAIVLIHLPWMFSVLVHRQYFLICKQAVFHRPVVREISTQHEGRPVYAPESHMRPGLVCREPAVTRWSDRSPERDLPDLDHVTIRPVPWSAFAFPLFRITELFSTVPSHRRGRRGS